MKHTMQKLNLLRHLLVQKKIIKILHLDSQFDF